MYLFVVDKLASPLPQAAHIGVSGVQGAAQTNQHAGDQRDDGALHGRHRPEGRNEDRYLKRDAANQTCQSGAARGRYTWKGENVSVYYFKKQKKIHSIVVCFCNFLFYNWMTNLNSLDTAITLQCSTEGKMLHTDGKWKKRKLFKVLFPLSTRDLHSPFFAFHLE